MEIIIPVFVIACIIVAIVVFASVISGRRLTREALTTYIAVLGSLAVVGALVAIGIVAFGS